LEDFGRDICENPGTAAVMSFCRVWAGYNGLWWAIFWFIITPGFWLGTGGLLGWVCHLISAWQAYAHAKSRPRF
jgi:hypothetical protein